MKMRLHEIAMKLNNPTLLPKGGIDFFVKTVRSVLGRSPRTSPELGSIESSQFYPHSHAHYRCSNSRVSSPKPANSRQTTSDSPIQRSRNSRDQIVLETRECDLSLASLLRFSALLHQLVEQSWLKILDRGNEHPGPCHLFQVEPALFVIFHVVLALG